MNGIADTGLAVPGIAVFTIVVAGAFAEFIDTAAQVAVAHLARAAFTVAGAFGDR